MRLLLLVLLAALAACQTAPAPRADLRAQPLPEIPAGADVARAAVVVIDGVYNSEWMAPYDIFQHTVYHDSVRWIQPFVVSPDGGPVVTSEGLTLAAHYSFDDAPEADILVIPSTEGSMDRDLEDGAYMDYIRRASGEAEWVITVCDGAFPLAATGALDGRVATTFPADRARLAEMFPAIDVRDDVRLVHDGKYVTSVGGAMSYEPALYVVEAMYDRDRADRAALGMVWPWDLAALPHVVADSTGA